MRSFRQKAAVAVVSLCCITGLSVNSVGAQDATPGAAGDCAVTTPEENVALVENLFAAMESGDADTIDTILADDLAYTIDRYGLPVDPASNDDEVSLAASQEQFYPGSTTTINDIFATDTRVAVSATLAISEHTITGESMTLDTPLAIQELFVITIECGEITQMDGLVDELELLTGLGILPPLGGEEATPAP